MQHQTGTMRGYDGTMLFTQCWRPDDPPRALVLLVHGYGEHSGRYQHVAVFLVARGYAVCALDHRGHGQSEGERVFIRRFDEYVTDLRLYFDQVRAEDPALPAFVYGHSMGSIIALRFALLYQRELAGLITTGTVLRPPADSALARAALRALAKIAPGARIIPPLHLEGLSRDPAVRAAYAADPWVDRGRLRVGWSAAMVSAAVEVRKLLPRLTLPTLALHGTEDSLVDPAAIDILRERAGSADLTLHRYPALRHELHNEPEQADVLGEIAAWLDAHTPPPAQQYSMAQGDGAPA